MKKTIPLIIAILLLAIMFATPSNASTRRGKRIIAEDKYIWIFVNGERNIIPENVGYPCFGQGIDNKNILYVPLNIIANIAGYVTSPIKSETIDGELKSFVTLSKGSHNLKIYINETTFDNIEIPGKIFILKGTQSTKNPVVMIPLGLAKDYFGLDIEVKRAVGRGVYDYCSLAINFMGQNAIYSSAINISDITEFVPTEEDIKFMEDYFYVSTKDNYCHKLGCKRLNDNPAKLSYFECKYWGFDVCGACFE